MRSISLRFVVALISFCLGVTVASGYLIYRQAQSQQARPSLSVESIPPDTLITLQRTGCGYGLPCPNYNLTIAADGTIVFNATAYWTGQGEFSFLDKNIGPKQSGVILSKVSQDQLRQIIREFERADYFSLRDSYQTDDACPGGVDSGNPITYTSIQINDRRKAISHYGGCRDKGPGVRIYPAKLVELEDEIDKIVNTHQWMQ